jgi:hypothetical protein
LTRWIQSTDPESEYAAAVGMLELSVESIHAYWRLNHAGAEPDAIRDRGQVGQRRDSVGTVAFSGPNGLVAQMLSSLVVNASLRPNIRLSDQFHLISFAYRADDISLQPVNRNARLHRR